MITWSRGALIVWAVLFGGIIAYELWSVIGRSQAAPPLTLVVVRYVPYWVLLPFLSWLLIHFAWHYARKK